MHGKVDLGKAKGLKQSEVKKLERLLQKRVPKDQILTLDLADSLAEVSSEIGHVVSLVVNRRGQIVNVTRLIKAPRRPFNKTGNAMTSIIW